MCLTGDENIICTIIIRFPNRKLTDHWVRSWGVMGILLGYVPVVIRPLSRQQSQQDTIVA